MEEILEILQKIQDCCIAHEEWKDSCRFCPLSIEETNELDFSVYYGCGIENLAHLLDDTPSRWNMNLIKETLND